MLKMDRFGRSIINGSTPALIDMLEKLVRDDEQFPGDARQKEAIRLVKSELVSRIK